MKRELLALGVATGAFLLNPHEAAAQESPVTEPTYIEGSCADPNVKLIETPTGADGYFDYLHPVTGEVCASLIPPLGPFENPNPDTSEPEPVATNQPKKPVEVQGIQISRDQLPHTGSQNGELTSGALALISLGALTMRAKNARAARYS